MSNCVPRGAAASIGKSDKSFHPKGPFEFFQWKTVSQGSAPPPGTVFPSENLTKAFTLKVPSSFSNGQPCPKRRRRELCPKRRRRLWGQCCPFGKYDFFFSLKVPSSFLYGKLCPQRRRRLFGHSSPSEILTKAFTLKVPSNFPMDNCVPRIGAASWDTVFHRKI